jgi:putative membrane protein insertion efficiency factor
MINKLFLKIIVMYKKILSPYIGGQCKYIPSCSDYGYDAISRYGSIKGTLLITSRILRCNPLAKGGYDPLS